MTPVSTFLNGRPVTQLRGLPFLSLSDVGHVVTSAAGTADAGGGITGGSATAGTASVPCRIDPLSGGDTLTADRIDERSTHALTVPVGTPLSSQVQFEIEDRGTFEVTAERERTAAQIITFEVVKCD